MPGTSAHSFADAASSKPSTEVTVTGSLTADHLRADRQPTRGYVEPPALARREPGTARVPRHGSGPVAVEAQPQVVNGEHAGQAAHLLEPAPVQRLANR